MLCPARETAQQYSIIGTFIKIAVDMVLIKTVVDLGCPQLVLKGYGATHSAERRGLDSTNMALKKMTQQSFIALEDFSCVTPHVVVV